MLDMEYCQLLAAYVDKCQQLQDITVQSQERINELTVTRIVQRTKLDEMQYEKPTQASSGPQLRRIITKERTLPRHFGRPSVKSSMSLQVLNFCIEKKTPFSDLDSDNIVAFANCSLDACVATWSIRQENVGTAPTTVGTF